MKLTGEWAEVYNSKSLLTKLGVGGVTDRLSSLDWQTYDFIPGSMITVRLSDMTNIPDGMEWGVIDTNLINITVGPSEGGGVARSMQVWRSTSNKTNYRFLQSAYMAITGSVASIFVGYQLSTKPRHGRQNRHSVQAFLVNCPAMRLQQQS